jgi:hypothetical protein
MLLPLAHPGSLSKSARFRNQGPKMSVGLGRLIFVLVPEEGLEPSQGYPYRILSPARLPFHHSGTRDINNEGAIGIQERYGSAENLAACCETLIAVCSKRLRGEAREKSTSVDVLSQYVGARRLRATKPMRVFQQPARRAISSTRSMNSRRRASDA